jgi:hypothetical protein
MQNRSGSHTEKVDKMKNWADSLLPIRVLSVPRTCEMLSGCRGEMKNNLDDLLLWFDCALLVQELSYLSEGLRLQHLPIMPLSSSRRSSL